MSTVTMQELELETAELLPARETLWCGSYGQSRSSTTVNQGSGDGNYDSYNSGGLISVNILSGDNGDFDGGNLAFVG
jgi:hypothetical protein